MTGTERRSLSSAILCLLWCLGCYTASAVVDANSTANTGAPPDGAPWGNVGAVNGSSGIYVGGGWVLTVAHVGAGNIELNGTVFPYDGTSQRLTNSNGSVTDMVLFRLGAIPPLPSLPLASRRPSASSEISLIGYGRIAGSSQTELGPYTGFNWSGGPYKSWGNNRVNAGGSSVINAGFGDVTAFSTDFTAPGPTQSSDEAQAAQGDSGGAVFQLSGQTWQLVGIMCAISNLPDQPAESAAYGNLTYSGDLATYALQIASIMAPTVPPLTISRSGSSLLVCWPDTGMTYSLEATANLSSPSWSTITPSLTVANGRWCALLPTTGNTRFFRLSNGPQP